MAHFIWMCLFCLLSGFTFGNGDSLNDIDSWKDVNYVTQNMQLYNNLRDSILSMESKWRIGANQMLTDEEKGLNKFFLEEKLKLLEKGYTDEKRFAPSKYFLSNPFEHDPDDPVYNIIHKLPKGALLHSHRSATFDLGTYVQFMFNLDNCRICENDKGGYLFHYYNDGVEDPPSDYTCRKCPVIGDEKYNEEVKLAQKKVSMYDGTDYSKATIQQIWDKFESKFGPTNYADGTYHVWIAMFKEILDLLVKDNVQYTELRTFHGNRKKKDGTVVSFEQILDEVETIIKSYTDKHDNFYGLNFIISEYRIGMEDSDLNGMMDKAKGLYDKSKLIRGFDLVGFEEHAEARSLKSVAPTMNKWRNNTGSEMPFVFHAGETAWTGFDVDENVVDAILLGTKRIGHGYALDAHPFIVEVVRQQGIGVELNPISNQILGLVDDIRNHRNKRLMDVANKPGLLSKQPIRFSVNSDDCLIFGTKPITDDLYAVVLAMTHKNGGLEVVKRIAYDSIEISLLNSEEQKAAKEVFEKEWNKLIKELTDQYLNNVPNNQGYDKLSTLIIFILSLFISYKYGQHFLPM